MMKKADHVSIVRRGNHFVLWRCGWVLVDGPWFYYLMMLSDGGSLSRVGVADKSDFLVKPAVFQERDVWPTKFECPVVHWGVVRWHPGITLSVRDVPSRLYCQWKEYQASRVRIGWRRLDGKLPAYLGRVDFADDPFVDDTLLRYEPGGPKGHITQRRR